MSNEFWNENKEEIEIETETEVLNNDKIGLENNFTEIKKETEYSFWAEQVEATNNNHDLHENKHN